MPTGASVVLQRDTLQHISEDPIARGARMEL